MASSGDEKTNTSAVLRPSTTHELTAEPTHAHARAQIGCLGVSPQIRMHNLALTSTAPIEVLSDRVRRCTVSASFACGHPTHRVTTETSGALMSLPSRIPATE